MFLRSLTLSIIFLSSNIIASDLPTAFLQEGIFTNKNIKMAAQCLAKKHYNFAASYLVSTMQCIEKTKIYFSATESQLLLIENCVAENMKQIESIESGNWSRCYKNGQLSKMMQKIVEERRRAEKLGALKLGKLFVPEKACRIKTTSNMEFDTDGGAIYIPVGTELGITTAGSDSFSVLVGISDADIVDDIEDYETVNCSKSFIEAISAYEYEKNSPYYSIFYAVQDVHVYSDFKQTKKVCSITRGTELEPADADYETNDLDYEGSDYFDEDLIVSEVKFATDATYCAGVEGFMNDGLILSFVKPPELGFLDSVAELPKCTEAIDHQSVFILKDNEGPDLRTCNFYSSRRPNEWCGKNQDDCIKN